MNLSTLLGYGLLRSFLNSRSSSAKAFTGFFGADDEESIEPAILAGKGAKIRGNAVRDAVVRAIRRGKRKWKRSVGYGKRWFVESFFSVFKRWFGEYVSSLRFENMKREIVFKVGIVNMFLLNGML